MKKNLFYIIILYALILSSCSTKQRVAGTWRVDTKGKEQNTEYIFQRNGTLEVHTANQEVKINSWEYSKKKKAITISKQGNSKSELYVINYMDPFFLGLSNKDKGLVLSRQLKIKSVNHKAARRKLKGEWSLAQLEDSTLVVGENNLKIVFWDNGISQEIMGDEVRLGRWILSDDNASLTLSNNNYTQTIGINFLKKRRIRLTDNYGSYLMKKTDRIPKSPSNRKVEKRIVGAWTLSKVGDKAVKKSNYTLYLNEDGSLKIFEQQHVSKVGQWYVSEDGAFLVLDHSNGKESYPIQKISRSTLDLLDDFQTIKFDRVKE
jgi:hypothetical protein